MASLTIHMMLAAKVGERASLSADACGVELDELGVR
jgi:hypothetical protein